MKSNKENLQKDHLLTEIWKSDPELFNLEIQPLETPALEKIFADFFSVGKYYFYVLNIAEGTLSNHHENIIEMHGFKKYPHSLSEIIDLIHPDDVPFVLEAEKKSYEKVKEIGLQYLLELKTSYCFRMKTGRGNYELFHHQALHTLQSEDGQILQAVNIHTNIQHLTEKNPYTVLISGVGSRNDFHQLQYGDAQLSSPHIFEKLTTRETEILNLIARGHSGSEISKMLIISQHTVKSHRRNILEKMQVRNSKELIRKALELAVI